MKTSFKSLAIISFLFVPCVHSQTFFDDDIPFEGELLDIETLSCMDEFNNNVSSKQKSARNYQPFKTGKNLRSGNLIFFGEGFADIESIPEDPNYIDAVQNAISLAGLRAKKDLALFRSVEINREIIDRALEAISSGVPVSDYGQRRDDLDKRELDYSKKGIGEKFYMWIDGKLDSWVGEKASIKEDRDQLEKELENVLSQRVFKEIITTLAYSEISGMKNTQIQVKKDKVCVLSVWTQRTKRWADELGNANYEALKLLRPGKKSVESLIPNKKSKEGLEDLLSLYGLNIDVDNNGELILISYAQAGAIDRSSSAINTAKRIAENRARGQIAQFQSEAVDVYENLENIQISTSYVDDTTSNYSERNFTARTKSASLLNIAGVELYDWWAAMHPLNKKPVVGVVLVWKPSNVNGLQNTDESEDFDELGF